MFASMISRKLWVGLALAVLVISGGWLLRGGVGQDLSAAGQAFVATLTPEQKAIAVKAYDDPLRIEWHFIPKPLQDFPEREGLQVKHMNDQQRKAARVLLQAGLSNLGYQKAETIMSLEGLLHELEKSKENPLIRDPERYYYTIFGQPSPKGTWGLSIEGHHLSLNFVVTDGEIAASTPTFFGANPATVKSGLDFGPKPGTRVLAPEEEAGFALLALLTPAQKKTAMIDEKAPADIRAAGEPQSPATVPEGLSAAEMNEEQVAALWELLDAYCSNVRQEVGEARLDAITEAGIQKVHFAWAGASEPGIGHYYRVQGPTFCIEFVNVQPDAEGNVANHIHSVWRDMGRDFALDR
ncbi:MAG: DUF3500 domain-containing protein [Pirellulales bacterium]